MGFYKNTELRNRLRTRAAEIKSTRIAGDKTVPYQLLEEFRIEFLAKNPRRTDESIYQLICYYLRDPNTTDTDRRTIYPKKTLQQLYIMDTKERAAFAEKTGRSLRAVNAAVSRYIRNNNKTRSELGEESAKGTINAQGFFDFSSPRHLAIMGFTHDHVVRARMGIGDPWGLALRTPNLLYHPLTKKVYVLNSTEQTELLTDPRRFLKNRAGYIKDHWQTRDHDPVDDAIQEVKSRAALYPETQGFADMTLPRLKANRTLRMIEALTDRLKIVKPIAAESDTSRALLLLKAVIDVKLIDEGGDVDA